MENDKEKSQYIKMTETSIPSLIIRLSIPTVISMLITNIYNLADTAFVGQLGNSESGAIGIVFSFMAFVQAIGFMFGQGSGSICSRLMGQENYKEASKTASTAFFTSLAVGIFTAAVSGLFVDELVLLLGSTPTIAPLAQKYMICILVASPFMITSLVLNNLLRYEGKAMLGMIGLFSGAIFNIILDPILMFSLNLGIVGAGVATALSQILSFGILLAMFWSGKTNCHISIHQCSLNLKLIGNICATGLPSLLRQGLTSVSTLLLNNLAADYGDEAVAAISIVSRIAMFIVSVSVGIGQGFQPVSGFNYGAKRYDRVREAFRFTVIASEILLGAISLGIYVISPHLIELFRNDQEVIAIGTRALRLQCLSLLIIPFCMVTEMLLQSTGQKLMASLLSSLKSGFIFIPVLILLAHYRGLQGIEEAQPLANIIAFIPSVIFAYYFLTKLKSSPSIDKSVEENQ